MNRGGNLAGSTWSVLGHGDYVGGPGQVRPSREREAGQSGHGLLTPQGDTGPAQPPALAVEDRASARRGPPSK